MMPLLSDASLIYGESAVIQCDEGFTVGGLRGGTDHYEVSCQATGELSTGRPTHGSCLGPKFPVGGEATDATDGAIKLRDVTITFFRMSTNESVASVTTVSRGRYSVDLPRGEYRMVGAKNGYVTTTQNLVVSGEIRVGQGADMALSKVLADGEYRVMLTWDKHSRDLDSYLYFDKRFAKYSWFGGQHKRGFKSGLSVDLDRDDVNSWGPETTTIHNVGECTRYCLIKFHVDNYTPQDGDLGPSKAIVKVYAGSGVVKQYDIPASVGDQRGTTVFTMDTSANMKIYDGDWTYGANGEPVKVRERDLCTKTRVCRGFAPETTSSTTSRRRRRR